LFVIVKTKTIKKMFNNNTLFSCKKKYCKQLIILAFIQFIFFQYYVINAQTQTFPFTGTPQTFNVPSCISNLTVTLTGAGGGGPNGGGGAQLNLNIPVQPGDVVTFIIGQSATGVAGGYPNGGNGTSSSTPGYSSYGGGGSSMIYINGVLVAVAGAGGGSGGGNTAAAAANGGCLTGSGTAVSPFGSGGGNGTQIAGGNGGPPWIASGNAGQAGAYLQGGNGASDPCFNLGPGGGGGGGYYGGGGGGSDCFGSGSLGGGAGGGGSSLIPPGTPCITDVNPGNGSAVVNVGGVSATNTGPYCAGGTISLHASSGLTYTWVGPNGFTSSVQNPTISNITTLNAGTYGVVVTGTGCADTAYTTVVVNPPITPNAGLDDTVCFGSPFTLNGSLTIPSDPKIWTYLATGITPTPNVTFSPNFTILTPTVNVSQPGLYRFILKETNTLCGAFRDTVKIYVKKMDITAQLTSPSCFGYSDGEILLGGNQAQEYSFDNSVTWTNNPLGTGFVAGNYTVCVRDNNLCKACSTVVITDPAVIGITTSNDTLICQNGTGYLSASATGGTTYTFNWSNIASTNDSVSVNPIGDSTYYVQAESENGCLSPIDSIIVSVRLPISGIISPQDTVCPGYPATLTVTGNDGLGSPYNFVWSDGSTGTGVSNTIFVTPSTDSIYTVTITDGCESSPLILSTTVIIAPLPVPLIQIPDGIDKKCEIADFKLLNITDSLMTQSVLWNISNGLSSSNIDTLSVQGLSAGSYDVQLIVTSPQGCIDSTTFFNFLTVFPQPVSLFKFSPNPVYMFNTQVNFTNYSTGAESFIWNIEQGSPAFSQLENPSTLFPDGQTGEYIVSLEVTSEFGCKDTLIQKVVVMPEVIIYAPNTFTPDNDEHNQNWGIHIEGIDVTDFNLLIFNRWGEIIWESNDPSATWDGSYNGSIIPQGTYSWIIRAKDLLNDGKYEFNGYINILR
jgi:gliding motility-associated-like protein